MDLTNPPAKYWHCFVKIAGQNDRAIVNDLTFAELERSIVVPWISGQPFSVSGTIVRSNESVAEIRIVRTEHPQQVYADQHGASMRASGITDLATNRRMIPFSKGEDLTFELLFSGIASEPPEPDVALVERVCRRLPQAARILATRSRKGKTAYEIADEYDVQDLLHATLRAYLKYSVQEDPLPKVAGAKSGRADISIEELGVLIEAKYVHGPEDQKRLFEEYSQDLVLYAKWPHLKTLIYFIYNSADLRDPEALEKLSATQEVNGRRFEVKVVLA